MPNPLMTFWLSAANAWAGAARSFWTAEMRRQQTAMINEMTPDRSCATGQEPGRSRQPTRGTGRGGAKVPTWF